MGHVRKNTQFRETADKRPPPIAQTAIQLLHMTAGETVRAVPRQIDRPHAPRLDFFQTVRIAFQQIAALYG